MIVFKGIIAILDLIFLSIFFAFMLTLGKREVKSNPVATAFFILIILIFAANTFLIFTM